VAQLFLDGGESACITKVLASFRARGIIRMLKPISR